MNSRDRRLARRKAEREALKKGSAATLTIEPREVAPGETLEDAIDAVALADGVEVGPILSPERAALARVTAALTDDEPPAPREASVEVEVTLPETITVPLTLSDVDVETVVAAARVNGEPVNPDGELAVMIRDAFSDAFSQAVGEMEIALPAEMQPGETVPERTAGTPEPTPPPAANTELRWTASFAPEGVLTDDGRAIAPGALSWRELPLTLMAMVETTESGHDGALVAGRIDRIWRDADGMIRGEGVFDGEGEFGAEIARMVAEETLRGVSIDMAIHSYEVGPRSDWFDEDGNWAPTEAAADTDEPSLLDILFGEEPDEQPIFVVTDAVIGAVTVCPFPAFANTRIEMAASLAAGANPAVWNVRQQAGYTVVRHPRPTEEQLGDAPAEGTAEAVTASAAGLAPVRPPAEWFRDPEFEELTPLTIDEDGRVYGHAWAWDTCHIGIPGTCTTAPRSRTGYAFYLLKEVECDDGGRVACGTITLDTGHADRGAGRAAAAAHYDDTGLAVADVIVGEDEHGGWVSGALRPDIPEEKARALRGAVLSGDWRNVDGNLELVALLAVNVPGFPVPRTRALVASGEDGEMEVLALVSAGIYADEPDGLDADAAARIAALRDQSAGRFRELAARIA